MNQITRRRALKTVAAAGPGLMLAQGKAIRITEREVEVTVTSVSPQTVRITVRPLENGRPAPVPADGALVKESWGQPVARLRTLSSARRVKCGDLTVTLSGEPLTIRVESKGGGLVQELRCDEATGKVRFQIGDAPLLGLGEGGPQFDRRGHADRMGSGQGGYQLATHGGRVPGQVAVGNAG